MLKTWYNFCQHFPGYFAPTREWRRQFCIALANDNYVYTYNIQVWYAQVRSISGNHTCACSKYEREEVKRQIGSVFQHGGWSSRPGQSMSNLGLTERHWDRFISESFRLVLSISFHHFTVFTHASSGVRTTWPLASEFRRDTFSSHRTTKKHWKNKKLPLSFISALAFFLPFFFYLFTLLSSFLTFHFTPPFLILRSDQNSFLPTVINSADIFRSYFRQHHHSPLTESAFLWQTLARLAWGTRAPNYKPGPHVRR